MDNWRESAWDGHQNEPHDGTAQLDGFSAFDAFGRRDGGAGHRAGASEYPADAPGYQPVGTTPPAEGHAYGHHDYGHPAGPTGYPSDDHGYPAGEPAFATGGQGYGDEGLAFQGDGHAHPLDVPGHEDETIAYRADAFGPDAGATAVGGVEGLTAELPAVTTAIPVGASAPVPPSAPAPPSASRSVPTDQELSDGPVFVDESGRRSKKFRRLGWVLATACAVYAITLVVSVIGGNSAAPWLLIPGPADEKKTETVQVEPAPSTSEAPEDGLPGTVPGAPAPTDSSGEAVPQPADGGSQGVPATPRPGTPSAPDSTPSREAAGGAEVDEKPVGRPTPARPTDAGNTEQPPPVTPPKSPDPDPTDTPPTPPTEEPADPPVGESGGQQMAAEGAQ
ncbi:hypothetical protein GCM10010393_07800 [Streptomyces gobitricini]|uniref:Uncharacterized protein n=1 Tax=Streptomyces gobitricini TaxID=68211 RepID=A0ABN3L9L3_9ACTN